MILRNSLPKPGKTQNGKTTTKPSTKGGNANRRNVATGIASQQIRLDNANESVRDYGIRIMNSKRRINKSMSACNLCHKSSSSRVLRPSVDRSDWSHWDAPKMDRPSHLPLINHTNVLLITHSAKGCLSLDSPKRARNAMGVFFPRSILHILPGT